MLVRRYQIHFIYPFRDTYLVGGHLWLLVTAYFSLCGLPKITLGSLQNSIIST